MIIIERARKTGAREISLDGYRRIFAVINRTLGDRVCASLTQADVETYLSTLKDRAGTGPASLATKAGRLGHLRMCMVVAGIANPWPELILPEDESDVEYFTLDEVNLAWSVTRPKERGFLAVALLGCVRPENLENMPADCVSLEARRIRIPKSIAKDHKTHLLDEVLPEIIWEWLKLYPYQPVAWAPLQRRLKRAVGRWIHDGIRHTGATYYCAVHGVSQTARLLTHESEKLVRSTYAGLVPSTEVARKFLALGPKAVHFKTTKAQVIWPADADLAAMLQQETGEKVAARLGCSDSMLTKHCRDRGIEKPGRGYWTSAA